MSIRNYWNLTATEQRNVRRRAECPVRSISRWSVARNADKLIAETEFEDAPGTSITLRADDSIQLSNLDGSPAELVNSLLGRTVV